MSPAAAERHRFALALTIALSAAGLFAVYPRVVSQGFRVVAGVPWDVRHSAFVLEWGRLCALGDPLCRDLWSPPVFHPEPETLTLSEPLLGLQPVYLPMRALGAAPAWAQLLTQAFLLLSIFFSAWIVYRRCTGLPPLPAALGAFVAAYAAPRSAQIEHILLFGQAPSLLAVLALGTALGEVSPRRGRIAVLAGFVLAAAQLWIGIYISWVTALFAALAVAGSCFLPVARRAWARTFRRDLAAWLLGPLLALLLTAPLLAAFARRLATHAGERPERIELLQPTLASWISPGANHLLWGDLARRAGLIPVEYPWEHALGLGAVTSLLALGGAVAAWRRPALRPLLLAAAALILLTLRWPGGGSAWGALVVWIPGAAAIRAIGRIGVILLPLWGLLVALAFAALARRWTRLTLALVALLVLIEPIRRHGVFAPATLDARAGRIAREVRAGDCTAFLVSPWRRRPPTPLAVQDEAMQAALLARVPTLNGYSSYPPLGWRLALADPTREPEAAAFASAARDWVAGHGLDAASICWIRADLEGPAQPRVERRALAEAWRSVPPLAPGKR